LPFRVEEIQTTRLLMRSRPSALARTFITVAAFMVAWLVITPARAANASGDMPSLLMTVMTVPAAAAPVAPLADPFASKAPLCDPRGAITFAPAPQMQDAEASLDSGLTFEDCVGSSPGEKHRVAPGRAPPPVDASTASNDALGTAAAVVTLARSARELLPAPAASTPCFRPGFRSTVDRPPRV
jgi:hypothetical protein